MQLLDVRDTARFLGVDESTVHRWVRRGELRALRIHDQPAIDRIDLLEFAAQRGLAVAPEMLADPRAPEPMPRLVDAIATGGVHHDVPGTEKASVLAAVVERLPVPAAVDRGFLLQMLLAREQLGSTGLGNGIALPHPRNPIVLRVTEPSVAICYLAAPVDFGAVDGQPVHTVIALVSPSVRVHLHLLASVAAALGDVRVMAALQRHAGSAELVPELERVEAARAARRPQRGDER